MAFLRNILIITICVSFLSAYSYAQYNINATLTQTCLGCMCEAISGCNVGVGCEGNVCGPFRITWAYWFDGGKPTVNNELNTSPDAYSNCVNDPYCAARAIYGYMSRYAQDCNYDGNVDCDDYIRIHNLGSAACNGALDMKINDAYTRCKREFQ